MPLEPTDDNIGASSLTNQSLPLPLSSHQALASTPIAVTSKRDHEDQISTTSDINTTATICTTIAAFTFTDLPIYPPLGNRVTVPSLTLGPGRYVLSFTNNYRVGVFGVETRLEGHSIISMHNIDNGFSGTVAFSLMRTTEVSFLFGWGMTQWQPGGVWLAGGEVALFRIGPG